MSPARSQDGWTALMHTAANGKMGSVRLLLDCKADIHAASKVFTIPLHHTTSLLHHNLSPVRVSPGPARTVALRSSWLQPRLVPNHRQQKIAATRRWCDFYSGARLTPTQRTRCRLYSTLHLQLCFNDLGLLQTTFFFFKI
jgi:hypothetical protein